MIPYLTKIETSGNNDKTQQQQQQQQQQPQQQQQQPQPQPLLHQQNQTSGCRSFGSWIPMRFHLAGKLIRSSAQKSRELPTD